MTGFGYRRDVPDERDKLFGAIVQPSGPLLPRASVRDSRVAIRRQLGTNACVGFSWAYALRLAFLARGIDCPELSPAFIYRLARNAGLVNGDDGARLRDAARAVKAMGCATEESWPFAESRINLPITPDAAHDARDRFGIRGYYRIPNGDVDGVKRALGARYSVVGGFSLTQAFIDWTGGDSIPAQRAPFVGAHAMCIDEYDGDDFGNPGSWGEGRGEAGYYRMSAEFIEQGTDVWAIDIDETSG